MDELFNNYFYDQMFVHDPSGRWVEAWARCLYDDELKYDGRAGL